MRVILDLKNAPLNYALGALWAMALTIICLAFLPFAQVPLLALPAASAIACTAIFLFNSLSALLLLLQFQESRRIAIALLAGACVYGAVMPLLQLLTWPGTLYEGAASTPGEDIRLWVLLYCGNPLLIAAALNSTNRSDRFAGDGPMGRRMWNFLAMSIPFALALGLALVASSASDLLPSFLAAKRDAPPFQNPIAYVVMALNAAVLVGLMLKTGLRTRLELFLALTVFGALVSLVFSLLGSEVYSVGWYLANLTAVISSATLLTALLWEVHVLYAAMHRINMTLRDELDRDRLTGVFTRRYFEERVRAAFRRAVRREEPLVLMFCDVDHFKEYNDSRGHQAGDACLAAVAAAMAEQMSRKGQFLARYGGDEFVAVLPGLDSHRAPVVAENLRRAVEDLRLRSHEEDRANVITVSIGWARMSRSRRFKTVSDLIRAADDALYESKRAGRNQVQATTV